MLESVDIRKLAAAVRADDVELAGSLLDERPELVNTDLAEDDERRPIHFAVLGRQRAMTRLLMSRGADARQGIHPHREPTAALTLALERGYDDIVEVIRKEEAKREQESRRRAGDSPSTPVAPGGTLLFGDQSMPLTKAVKDNDLDALTRMLDEGADADEPTRLANVEEDVISRGSPLWACAVAAKYDAARRLLKAGADPNAMVYASGTPVFQAYGQRDQKMIELLESYGGIADPATLGHYRQTERATAMLEDADSGRLPDGFATAEALAEELLWSAACGGDPETVKRALEHIDWPRQDRRWYRMLEQPLRMWNHMGTFWENTDFDRTTYRRCLELLLERCDPNVEGRFGMCILHDLAAARAHVTDEDQVDFATLLLDAGAELDRRDDLLCSTPLGWACRWGRTELVGLLLSWGADPVEAGAEPWATPRAWAVKNGNDRVLRLLGADA